MSPLITKFPPSYHYNQTRKLPLILERFETFDQIDKKLRNEWNGLLLESDTISIFMTYEWLRSWWYAYGKDNKLCTISARDPNGILIGIAPLYVHRSKYYKIPVKEVSFIGDKASDRQNFIIHKEYPEAYEAILNEIVYAIDCDIVRLEQVPAESVLLQAIEKQPIFESEIDTTLPYVGIKYSWEDYHKRLSRKFKRDLKHKYNVLKKAGPWEIKCITDAETISKRLERIAEIEIESRKAQRGYAFFADRRALALHREFLELSRPHQWAALFLLSSNDVVISYLMAFIFNDTLCAYNMAYIPEFYRMSPGKLVLNEAVRYAFDNQLTEFDFLRGNSYIKTLWCKEARRNHRIVLFNSSFKAAILRCLVFYARPLFKSLFKCVLANQPAGPSHPPTSKKINLTPQ